MVGILKLNNGYGMLLQTLMLAVVMSFMAVGAAEAQEKKPRKKLKQLLCIADSLRKELRKSADRGQMLQWGDSTFMAELDKSRISEKKKLRIMKHYPKIQRRLSFYDRMLFWGDSILAAKYKKIKFDTNYISRPDARWTIKFRGNLSGADMQTTTVTQGVENRTHVMANCRGTLSMAVAYRGLAAGVAVNPAKLAGKSKDFEFNLNSYSNRYGFDVVYLSSKTLHGHKDNGTERIDIPKGKISQNAININFYYAFNSRKFSFPAAFSQSYIQKRSAGSWMIGASFDGSKTTTEDLTIRLNEWAVGAGYAFNLVAFRRFLFHLSALPTVTVYSHDYTKTTTVTDDGVKHTERHNMEYHFPSAIITSRAAAVYSWRNKFAGATAVYNYSVAGDEDHLQLKRNKWRVRMFFGFRF